MTQIFSQDGKRIPVTAIAAGPCFITQLKTKEKDGYDAVQIGFDTVNEARLSKPERGHLKKSGAYVRKMAEFHISEDDAHGSVGDVITGAIFQENDRVSVQSVSKGKGFQGVVRRHGFHGSPATHGHKDQLRMPGSIGATNPQRVTKGRRMAGRMGNETVTVNNMKVVRVDGEKGIIYLKGAVPGARGALVGIKTQ